MRQHRLQQMARITGPFQLAAVGCLIGILGLLLAATLPMALGNESFVVYSGSMEPTIRVGDVAVVEPTRAGQLKVGDVITYRAAERPEVVVTHRVIDIAYDEQGRPSFKTKGDANESSDQVLVRQDALVGRVVYSLPKIGYLAAFAQRLEAKILLIALPGLLLLLDEVMGSRRRQQSTPATQMAPAQQSN